MCEPTSCPITSAWMRWLRMLFLKSPQVQSLRSNRLSSASISAIVLMRIWSSCLITSVSTLMPHVLAALNQKRLVDQVAQARISCVRRWQSSVAAGCSDSRIPAWHLLRGASDLSLFGLRDDLVVHASDDFFHTLPPDRPRSSACGNRRGRRLRLHGFGFGRGRRWGFQVSAAGRPWGGLLRSERQSEKQPAKSTRFRMDFLSLPFSPVPQVREYVFLKPPEQLPPRIVSIQRTPLGSSLIPRASERPDNAAGFDWRFRMKAIARRLPCRSTAEMRSRSQIDLRTA